MSNPNQPAAHLAGATWLPLLQSQRWADAEQALTAQLGNADEATWQTSLAPVLAGLTIPVLVQFGLAATGAQAFACAEALFLVLEQRLPKEADPSMNLARVRYRQRKLLPAFDAAERAMQRAPARADSLQLALTIAGDAGIDAGLLLKLAERWCQLAPQDANAHYTLAGLHLKLGAYAEVHKALDRALAAQPQFLPALWMRLITPAQQNMHERGEQAAYLQRGRETLRQIAALPLEAPAWRPVCAQIMSAQPNFFIAYLGEPLVDDMRAYGDVLTRISRAVAGSHESPRRTITRPRRRIGIVSRYLHRHSVSKLFMPLFLALDRNRFECIGIYPGRKDDSWVQRFRSELDGFVEGDADGPTWAARIAALDCDVLIYLDLGMNAITHSLAALRLAPVQAMFWGHPFTSGLATIDYLLSSDAMEPADGASHYRERLLRLPALGCGFEWPDISPNPQFTVNRGAGRRLAVCAQMWAKLGPAHDLLFARLLAAAPMLDLHLTPLVEGEGRTLLSTRLRDACAAHGVDFEQRIVIQPRLAPGDFQALIEQADFLLDSLNWSGGVTAFESFARGKPIVTLPGPLMRGRHTMALLRHMGIDALVARDADDYVAIAARLANEPAFLSDMSAEVTTRRSRLFEHRDTQSAFADWLATVTPRPD